MVKIFADGVFDLMHSGHFNAVRQARGLGDYLVVGINSDKEVKRAKGTFPIYSQEERADLMRGCKWVDEVIVGTPYAVTLDFLNSTGCDFVAHGDDFVASADGTDCYEEPRKAGRLRTFNRTVGVSTTLLISRLLASTPFMESISETSELHQKLVEISTSADTLLISSRRISQFIDHPRAPSPGDKIVYVDGSFDIFHVGHLKVLNKAKTMGDYLIVGIHDDSTVKAVKGSTYPVMSLIERTLNVLGIRGVDEVIVGAPWDITEYLLEAFKIDLVVRGTRVDSDDSPTIEGSQSYITCSDPYHLPKSLGIYKEIESESYCTTGEILRRICDNKIPLMNSILKRQKNVNTTTTQRCIVKI